jgi:hypothetical protein
MVSAEGESGGFEAARPRENASLPCATKRGPVQTGPRHVMRKSLASRTPHTMH